MLVSDNLLTIYKYANQFIQKNIWKNTGEWTRWNNFLKVIDSITLHQILL